MHERLKDFPDIIDMHDCHAWTMDGQYNIMTVHLIVSEGQSLENLRRLKSDIREELSKFNIDHLTIEFETPDEQCSLKDC